MIDAAPPPTNVVEVRAAGPADAPLLRALLQLYVHDLSDCVGADVGDDGLFAVPPLDPWFDEAGRHPFVIVADGKHAGFALVAEKSRLSGERGINDVAEFFVLRRYRRRSVGARAAKWLFDRFAGPWEVRQMAANRAATQFWRSVIANYTNGVFDEVALDDARWRGPVQRFVSPPPLGAATSAPTSSPISNRASPRG